tara:strand:- start:242 stop:655 length:414 start_codon:yes stop_codon:yes gene_type:complete
MGRVFFNTKLNLDTDACTSTTTYVVKQSDSGKTFMVSGGAQAITLPPVADLQEGFNVSFVNAASPSGDKTIGAGSAIIHGVMQDAGNGAAASTAGSAVSNVIVEAAGQAGDRVEFFTDGSLYYFKCFAGTDTAFTTS